MMQEWLVDAIGSIWRFDCDVCHITIDIPLNRGESWEMVWKRLNDAGWTQRHCPDHKEG